MQTTSKCCHRCLSFTSKSQLFTMDRHAVSRHCLIWGIQGKSFWSICIRFTFADLLRITYHSKLQFLDIAFLVEEPGSVLGCGFWKLRAQLKNLHILNAEVVLITVWGTTFWNQWEYYGLRLTSCVIIIRNWSLDHLWPIWPGDQVRLTLTNFDQLFVLSVP